MSPSRLKVASILFVAVIGILCAIQLSSKMEKYPRYTYIASNDHFKIRVQMFPEEGVGFVLGACYVFEASGMGSDSWIHVMTYKHDDPDPIPYDRVRFVNDGSGYVFTPYKFASTTTTGTTWQVWDITRDLPGWRERRAAISGVQVEADGTGVMKLNLFSARKGELRTTDYGAHWQED